MKECHEKKFGEYLVKAIKRHVKENIGNVGADDCHHVYSLFYNVLIDFEQHGEDKSILQKLNICPPICMRKGSLLHCLKWTKWKIDCLKST